MSEMNGARHFNETEFHTQIEEGRGLAVVDFWAPWCGPCRAIGPHVDALANDLRDQVLVAKIDIDQHPGVAERLGIMGVPTLLIYRDGAVVDRIVGTVPPAVLRRRVEAMRENVA